MNHSQPISLYELADERFEKMLSLIPIFIYRQLDYMTWSERIGENEYSFTVRILEIDDECVHLVVTAITPGSIVNPATGTLNIEVDVEYYLDTKSL